jgi:hypothetical protein
MRPRPIRSQIYLPVTRFGVVDADWKFVFITTFVCYTVPFMLDLRVLNIPVELWASLLGLVSSVAFFNYVRIGRKPLWLQHQITAYLRPSRRRLSLPTDAIRQPWLVNADK